MSEHFSWAKILSAMSEMHKWKSGLKSGECNSEAEAICKAGITMQLSLQLVLKRWRKQSIASRMSSDLFSHYKPKRLRDKLKRDHVTNCNLPAACLAMRHCDTGCKENCIV